MTDKEKARAYDMALEKARKHYNSKYHPSEGPNGVYLNNVALEEMFPVLKESEDETIRESLIEFLTEIKYLSESGRTSWAIRENDAEMCKSFLDYLEKQKNKLQSTDSIPSDTKYEDRWHKVKDSLPNSAREVLCRDAIGNFFIGRYYKSSQSWEASMYDDCDKRIDDNPPVVKWCEIPTEKQEEQPITANDLDEEIHRFFDECIDVHEAKLYGSLSERVIPVDCYELTARHFAKWGERKKEQKPVECIEFDNEFENQVSHLLASVLNGEWEYNEGFVKHAAQSLLGYAKNELKPDEWIKREKLFMKALQTTNAQIGELVEENYKLKEQKPKMTPKWLYRLEFKDNTCGLWYDGNGKWCFESGIGSIDGCKTKTLPMDYDERYKQDGRNWFSSCSKKEDLLHWYSLEDAKKLISNGFVFTRYLATEYHEYDQQTVFIKETSLYREEIDIFELFKQKPAEKQDYSGLNDLERAIHRGFLVAGVENVSVTLIKETAYDCLAQMKPAEWSEEDEKVLREVKLNFELNHEDMTPALVACYERFFEKVKSLHPVKQEWSEDIIRKAVKEVGLTQHQIDWFKTNVFPPKQEWSDEDEEHRKFILELLEDQIRFCKKDAEGAWHAKQIRTAQNWFKFLRPQPHMVSIKNATKFGNLEYERGVKDGIQSEKSRQWKPSDEQLRPLEYAIDYFKKKRNDTTYLESLYNDLKKL